MTQMEHTSINRRMIIWIVCTLAAIVGAVKAFAFPPKDISFFFYLFMCLGAFAILIINETVFGIRKARLEIDRDEMIKARDEKQSSTVVLAICPECKSRIPANAKYCPECGADLQSKTP